MSALKNIGFGAVALTASAQNAMALSFGSEKVDSKIQGSTESADVEVQTLVGKAMMFLGILAVLYAIWGGFQIMTAGGDDEKVKTGKTILIQAAIGLVVIFLANSAVQFVLRNLLGGN